MLTKLSPDQEEFIQTKLQGGRYRSAEEVLALAFRLLDEYDRTDTEWLEDARSKVDAAIEASAHTPAIDGETFVTSKTKKISRDSR